MTQIKQLSEHFSLIEATQSQTAERLGIDNSHPELDTICAATKTATKLEIVRSVISGPIKISSWIRCLELNRALKSKDTSQHIKGEAVDFISPPFSPLEICKIILLNKEKVNFDQLILEHTWVHISWNSAPDGLQKGQVLSLLSGGGYATGLTDSTGKPYK